VPGPDIGIEKFLAQLALFRELGSAEIERIGRATRQIRAERGAILFHRGDEAAGIHVLVFGQVKLSFTSAQGGEKVVEIIGPGQSFGEAVVFAGKPYPVTATALADLLLLFIEKNAVLREVDGDPQFARRVIAGLCRRIHSLMADLEGYSLSSGTQRVIGFLLSGCGEDATGPLDVLLPTTKGVLSSRLNLTQEHFSRILHELSSRGLIEVQGRAIRVADVERLRGYQP